MKTYDPRKILVPVDLSECSPSLIQTAVDIAVPKNAEIEILHVAEKPNIPAYFANGYTFYQEDYTPYGDGYTPYRAGYAPDAGFSEKLREDIRTRIENQLEDLARKHAAKSKIKTSVLWGHPVEEIIQEAESGNFDLIVMATRGRKGINHFLMGSVAEGVIRRASCPVLAIRVQKAEERAEAPGLTGAATS